MDKNYVFVFTLIPFFLIISHMNKSPDNQFFESLEICIFASNLKEKKKNLEKTPKIFFFP